MKAFALATTAVVLGVAFLGSATTCQLPVGYEIVDVSVNVNASFLAPVPINYTVVPLTATHSIYIGSHQFFYAIED
ncbi:MAG: hypothetical protein FE041_01480 [Thermoplasmata archaeon]|nr:MAG: hypothetical protein FE041_01480 [Thermoplasmata archaeon]